MRLNKIFELDCAHFLPKYNGKCERLHGHTYRVIVSIRGDVDPESGLVMDFTEMKKIFKDRIYKKLDHTLLNDFISNPSAENISIWIWNELKDFMPICKITVYETPTSYAEYEGEYHLPDKANFLVKLLGTV